LQIGATIVSEKAKHPTTSSELFVADRWKEFIVEERQQHFHPLQLLEQIPLVVLEGCKVTRGVNTSLSKYIVVSENHTNKFK
jgi:hypothetical protein